MTWLPNSESIWATLAEKPARIGIYYAKEIISGENGVLLAQDSARGNRHLLMRIPDMAAVVPDVRSRGVKLDSTVLEGADGGRFANFWCNDPAKQKLFGVMVDEILGRVAAKEGTAPAIAAQVLRNWRGLLGSDASRALTFEEQAGLFAELIVLEEIARHTTRALDSWKGPFAAPHDFEGIGGSIEVKATLTGKSVVIHGLRQLELPPRGTLNLCVITLSNTPAGESLPERVRKTAATIGNDDTFYPLLGRVGYVVGDSSQYEATVFHVESTRVYAVDEMFPRITASLLSELEAPDSIGQLQYELILAGIASKRLPDADWIGLLSSFMP
jgi:hypothetical protein